MQAPDFLAIGDIVTDAFIKLSDAEVKKCVNHDRQELCLSFGDKVPFDSATIVPAVGNAANAAVAAARLGIQSALLSHVGDDYHGTECIETLKKNNVDTGLISIHTDMPTNYHYVLWYDVERTILIKHTPFPYSIPEAMPTPKMIYLSSIGEHDPDYHHKITAYVAAHPEIKLMFQPGTFQIKLGTEKLKDVYEHTYAFFCNVEEAQRILGVETRDLKTLLAGIHTLGPTLVFITDGIDGAYASDGTTQWFIPVYPQEPFERTGAGDAFASTVSVALLQGCSVPEALIWGPINSMSVTKYIGAQEGLLTKQALEDYIQHAPEVYRVREL